MGPKDKKEKSGKKLDKAAEKSSEPVEGESLADGLRREGIVCTYSSSREKIHRNVRDIAVQSLTLTFHGVPLVEEAELSLNYGNRYGFIGRNGCGKSTFMRVIGARSFPIADGIDLFHLKEEIEPSELTAKEAVMSVDTERATLEQEADELNDILADENCDDHAEYMDRLTQVYERLEELDAATAETRASKILNGLGFTPETQQKKCKEFSGGWRMRIALARALFIQPTLLILDEPTNHLDMEAVVWLEDYLSKWDKILLMVSHSQDFMNSVCTHIMHLTKKRLTYYTGNYDSFVNTRAEKEEEQMKKFQWEQDQIKHMKEYVARFGQGNAKMARQAQSKEKVGFFFYLFFIYLFTQTCAYLTRNCNPGAGQDDSWRPHREGRGGESAGLQVSRPWEAVAASAAVQRLGLWLPRLPDPVRGRRPWCRPRQPRGPSGAQRRGQVHSAQDPHRRASACHRSRASTRPPAHQQVQPTLH